MVQSHTEIVGAWLEKVNAVAQWFEAEPDSGFTRGPEGKWTAGQHLDHLIRSTKPLNMALRLPKIALRMKFGTADNPSKNYDGMVSVYHGALSAGGKASGQFVPKPIPVEEKPALIAAFREEGDKLVKALDKWTEKDLDRHLLPHPLLGNLTVREMLYFTIYHTGHHHATLVRDHT